MFNAGICRVSNAQRVIYNKFLTNHRHHDCTMIVTIIHRFLRNRLSPLQYYTWKEKTIIFAPCGSIKYSHIFSVFIISLPFLNIIPMQSYNNFLHILSRSPSLSSFSSMPLSLPWWMIRFGNNSLLLMEKGIKTDCGQSDRSCQERYVVIKTNGLSKLYCVVFVYSIVGACVLVLVITYLVLYRNQYENTSINDFYYLLKVFPSPMIDV